MRIAYENLADGATITASSSDSSHPVSNLQDERLSTLWASTAVTAQSIYIDMGSAVSVNTVALMGHNISSSATVTIYAGATTAVSALSSAITYNDGMMLLFSGGNTYRYWKLSISGNDAAPQAGRLWLGNYITIDPSSLLDFTVTKLRSDNVAHNASRGKYASEGVGWRRFSLDFPPTGGAMLASIEAMYDHSRNHGAMIFCNFDTIRDYHIVEPCYVSLSGDMAFKHAVGESFTYTLTMEEEL